MTERSAFSGGDQEYLRTVQYATGVKLDVRSYLHRTFATSEIPLPEFEAGLINWSGVTNVLECGCGTGRFWETDFLPRTINITLSDLSPGMVEAAVVNAGSHGFVTVDGRVSDIQVLPFEKNSFDVVIANHMLYHVPDPDLGVAEIARVLRPDGVALIATNGYGHMRDINEAIDEVFGGFEEGLYEIFGIDSGEARLREKFESVVWHAFNNDLIVDDPEAVVGYGLSYPPGEFATPAQQSEFQRAIARRFENGKMRVRTRAGVFVCRRLR